MVEIIQTKNSVYIDNISPLAWNTSMECTYCGCVTRLLNALGCDAAYEQIMGLTASCFRTSLFYGWDAGSNILDLISYHLGTSITENMLHYYGWESYHPENADTRDREVMASLDKGIPVMVLGGRRAPEWSILLGYEKTADGVKFFGRSYFDKDAPSDECFTPNGYTWANNYPGEGEPLLFRKGSERVSFEDALKKSLETCLAMFHPHEKFGYGAYTCMIDSFHNNSFLTRWGSEGEIQTIIVTLTDARRAAATFLKDSAELLTGINADKLRKVSSMYAEIHQILLSIVQHESFNSKMIQNSKDLRECFTEKLECCLVLERDAHKLIADIVAMKEESIIMKNQINIVPFSSGAESNGFIAALASAVLPCLGITADTPYWCGPKDSHCIHCSGCDTLQKHQEMLYHTLLTASGMAFTFDYPEDDSVGSHTMPDVPIGWRWEEPFVAELMDFAGLSYERYTGKTVSDMHGIIKTAIDAGYTAICANTQNWTDEMAWTHCWNVVCGYANDGIRVMRHGGEIVTETEGTYDDWIVITGRADRRQTYRDVLERIHRILTDPSHDRLEQEIYSDLSSVTPDNAVGLAFKMMGINGVPIETRWHSAEAFGSCDNLLSSMTDDNEIKSKLSDLFLSRYIADNNNETHGTGWKIWGALNVGPNTGYMPTEESFALIQKPEVQEELKRLFKIVFDNDRAVAEEIHNILKGM